MNDFNPAIGYEFLKDRNNEGDSFGSAPKFRRAVNNAVASGVRTFEGFMDIYTGLSNGFISVDAMRAQSFQRWLLKEHDISVNFREGDLAFKPIQDKGVKFDRHTLTQVRNLILGLSDRPAQVFYMLASCGLTPKHIEQFSRLDGNNFHQRNGHIYILTDEESGIVNQLLNGGELSKLLLEYLDDSKDKKSEKLNKLWNHLSEVASKDEFPYSFYEVLRIWELDLIKNEGSGDAFNYISQRTGVRPTSIRKRWVTDYPGKRISHQLAAKYLA